MIFRSLIFIIVLCTASPLWADGFSENSDIKALFQDAGIEGTFVVYDISEGRFIGHNARRAKVRFIPASTFKIANSLIGLQAGALSSVDEILPYGGKPQPIKAWQKDMSIADAIKISNVPIFQELARRIGLGTMQEMITTLGYGNHDIGDVVDQFWLDGPLKISALEQVNFIERLISGTLPILPEHQKAVREILLLEQTEEYSLYVKSGWTTTPDPDTGWWVGWIERDGKNYAFALNIDTHNMDDVALREKLSRASLKILGLL